MSPPKPHRRWFQFRLRTLLIAVTLAALLLGRVAWEREQCRRGEQAIEMLHQKSVFHDWLMSQNAPSSRPERLKVILGDDQFRTVRSAIFDGDSLADSDLRQLAVFPNLHSLIIQAPNVTDEGLSHLRGVRGVKQFEFSGNRRASGKNWHFLSGWQQLRFLSFHDSLFDDDDVRTLPALKNLKKLRVSETIISNAGLERISLLTSLESLDLSSTQVTDKGLVHLRRLVNLKELSLKNTNVTDKGVKELQRALPNTLISH
ncbi:MAG: hypothetical protein ACR2FY_19495 [Pirellulaceae bacterium]